ncbi:MAG: hypothetical protein HS127_09420 [Planctomycetia bacterium]|nr:hypothetical protein [Planctomycetia bacterium]
MIRNRMTVNKAIQKINIDKGKGVVLKEEIVDGWIDKIKGKRRPSQL